MSAANLGVIGQRLVELATRVPGKTALVEANVSVDYARLESRTRAIAARVIAAAGTRPGFAALHFETKLPAVEAMFGTLRAGHAYVPLDAGDPDERLGFILADSRPAVLLTDTGCYDRACLLARSGCTVIDIGRIEPPDETFVLPDVPPQARAYLLYTSGSTGRPKGVSQTVDNLRFFADAYVNALHITEGDRLSLLFAVNFAASLMHIYGSLLKGATLCAYDMRRQGIPLLADWLDRERITVLHTIPTIFRELCNSLAPERRLAHLRGIDLAGEAAFANDFAMFRRHTLNSCVLVNQLGATENDIIAQHVVGHDNPPPTSGTLPVGRSPAGVHVWIRRADGGAADRNEVGAIVVAGSRISPGYLNRPELDAVAFPPDPNGPGARFYISGDLGRIDDDGNLHFIGRQGSRVKIRGHSVDLMEVEAAMAACPGIQKAAVLASAAAEGQETDRLVAYVVVGSTERPDPVAIRDRLATRLPPYMLPTVFQFLKALPLTTTGKIDRRALAALEPAQAGVKARADPPQDDLELAIAGIFQRVLKRASVDRHDDFFLLGADSLLFVDLQNRLLETFGVEVENFHRNATVAAAASAIRRQRAVASGAVRPRPVLVPLQEHGTAPPLFLVHGRLPQVLVSPHFLGLLGSDQPVWAFQARGLDGLQAPHSSLEDMAKDYVREMRKVRPRGPYFLGALCIGALIAVEMARALRAAGESVLPLLLLDPPIPYATADPALNEDAILKQLRKLQRGGVIAASQDDPAYLKRYARTVQAFEEAITRYRPLAYDGPVFMLSSRARIAGAKEDDLRRIFTGQTERYEVAAGHREALVARSPQFAAALAQCLGRIREAAAAI